MELKMKLNMNFKSKQTAMGTLSLILIVAGIVLLNLIVEKIPAQLDLTSEKLYTLSSETTDILNNLDKDITVYALYSAGQTSDDIMDVLDLYKRSSPHFTVEIIDPDRNPGLLNRFQKEDETAFDKGSLIVFSGELYKVIPYQDLYETGYNQQGQIQVYGFSAERQISSALSYINTGYSPILYEITGHYENKLEDISAQELLEKSNYMVKQVNLLKEGGIPNNADVALLNSPKTDFNPEEIKLLRTYLKEGGKIFIALDLTNEPLSALYALLAEYNISIQHGITLEKDTSHLLPGNSNNPVFFSPLIKEHELTDFLIESDQTPFFYYAMGIGTTENQLQTIHVEPLFTSSARSFLRTDLNNSSETRDETDTAGPITVAAAVYKTDRETGQPEGMKMVLITSGTSLTYLPGLGQIRANMDFFTNSMNWLSDRGDSVSLKSKSLYDLPLQMTGVNAWIYAVLTVILIPLLVGLTGFIVLLRRKNL
jgi:ABC-2 type transport system permease protein